MALVFDTIKLSNLHLSRFLKNQDTYLAMKHLENHTLKARYKHLRTVYPVGTTLYKPDRCCNGYTILWRGQKVKLIDMNGRPVNEWLISEINGADAKSKAGVDRARLLENGNVIVQTRNGWAMATLSSAKAPASASLKSHPIKKSSGNMLKEHHEPTGIPTNIVLKRQPLASQRRSPSRHRRNWESLQMFHWKTRGNSRWRKNLSNEFRKCKETK